ncbi:hypothetical protein BHM03_00031507 [Ensete ventricosum]|uniref:Uncharacterized protein n=1 Tax=Ensete ventricosum TaxID=4639 RepID=A0A445MIN8_ENSVE|nr:hypothetical protein BHM03_00031507 [Ensete ventricosum]
MRQGETASLPAPMLGRHDGLSLHFFFRVDTPICMNAMQEQRTETYDHPQPRAEGVGRALPQATLLLFDVHGVRPHTAAPFKRGSRGELRPGTCGSLAAKGDMFPLLTVTGCISSYLGIHRKP